MSQLRGGCRCGAVRYTVALETLPRTYACHCRDCQTWTGSAFSQQALLPDTALNVSGPVTVFELTTPSGSISTQRMCGVCHTRIYNSNSGKPGFMILRAGTLDRSDELDVAAHIWVNRKQPWLELPDDVATWPEAAPFAQLLQVLASDDPAKQQFT
ncbi:GFA family protein [Piscinibacter sp. XHJ-5]|uniref:GFA family protein n=1 Tax=Piscinibacter sp. XHJ-5 TaxID=3037797 RepID=UPI00245369A8|nr:GFA family protein [Piscinibacter sp. XHJ-5]